MGGVILLSIWYYSASRVTIKGTHRKVFEMSNSQLAILLECYARLLSAATDSVREALPDEAGETRRIVPLLGVPYEQTDYPCLFPLDELIEQMQADISALRAAE